MRTIKLLVSLLTILIFTFSARTENQCGVMYPQDTSSWGIGFIRLPKDIVLKGLTTKTKKDCYISNGIVRFSNDSIQKKIDRNDLVYISEYYYVFLKVYKIDDTKYMVCLNTLAESIWVDVEEFNSRGIYFMTYLSILENNFNHLEKYLKDQIRWTAIGVNLTNSCLNLRSIPSTKGEVVTCLKDNTFEDSDEGRHTHLKILRFEGNWAYVLASDYEYDPILDEAEEGCAFKVVNEYRGYVKVMDDNGRPNIWYAVR